AGLAVDHRDDRRSGHVVAERRLGLGPEHGGVFAVGERLADGGRPIGGLVGIGHRRSPLPSVATAALNVRGRGRTGHSTTNRGQRRWTGTLCSDAPERTDDNRLTTRRATLPSGLIANDREIGQICPFAAVRAIWPQDAIWPPAGWRRRG